VGGHVARMGEKRNGGGKGRRKETTKKLKTILKWILEI
jgi:hypothetical protein